MEFQTAKSLYRLHGRRLETLFSREEISYIQKDKAASLLSRHVGRGSGTPRALQKPYERLAVLLAAKEAVFKALSPAWMGISGFQDIQIFPQSNHRLAARLKGSFSRLNKKQKNLEISLLKKHRNYVVVGCRGMV